MVFFLLSGMVLSFPLLRGKQQPYPRYLLRRTLRIYGPYLIAIGLAMAGVAFWHTHPGYRNAWSADDWTHPLTRHLVLQHLLFLGAYNTQPFDFVIWTLVHEMRISIFFPLLFWLVQRLRLWGSLLFSAAIALGVFAIVPASSTVSARYSYPMTLFYATFFVAGILLASRLQLVEALWRRLSVASRCLLFIGTLLLYSYNDRAVGAVVDRVLHAGRYGNRYLMVEDLLTLVAAVGWIVIALNSPLAGKILRSRPCHFLGRISYSLYLIHPLVLLTITSALGTRLSPWIQFPLYIAGALLAGWLFCLLVEEPCIRLGRSLFSNKRVPSPGVSSSPA
jgi:peptidoglycan/LPS O-acetylase OafA/YrhL